MFWCTSVRWIGWTRPLQELWHGIPHFIPHRYGWQLERHHEGEQPAIVAQSTVDCLAITRRWFNICRLLHITMYSDKKTEYCKVFGKCIWALGKRFWKQWWQETRSEFYIYQHFLSVHERLINWQDALRDDCDSSDDCVTNCCVSPILAPCYFVVFVLISQFVLVRITCLKSRVRSLIHSFFRWTW